MSFGSIPSGGGMSDQQLQSACDLFNSVQEELRAVRKEKIVAKQQSDAAIQNIARSNPLLAAALNEKLRRAQQAQPKS